MALSQASKRALESLDRHIPSKRLTNQSDLEQALSTFVELHRRGDRPESQDVEAWFFAKGEWQDEDVHTLGNLPFMVSYILDKQRPRWKPEVVDRWFNPDSP